MPVYDYQCIDCLDTQEIYHGINEKPNIQCLRCNGDTKRLIGTFSVAGSRDTFGIGKSFKDDKTGKTIDNWKSWEKAGYRNPLETVKSHTVKEKIKEGIKKRRSDTWQKKHYQKPK